jgi:hypothetical protein
MQVYHASPTSPGTCDGNRYVLLLEQPVSLNDLLAAIRWYSPWNGILMASHLYSRSHEHVVDTYIRYPPFAITSLFFDGHPRAELRWKKEWLGDGFKLVQERKHMKSKSILPSLNLR